MKFNLYLAATVSAWLLTILIILSEFSSQFKTLLTSAFTHHWIGKIVLITLAFVISGFLSKNIKYSYKEISWYSVLGSLLIILLFYIWHFYT